MLFRRIFQTNVLVEFSCTEVGFSCQWNSSHTSIFEDSLHWMCHLRCHVRRPVYKCPLCDVSSTYHLSNIRVHIRKIHNIAVRRFLVSSLTIQRYMFVILGRTDLFQRWVRERGKRLPVQVSVASFASLKSLLLPLPLCFELSTPGVTDVSEIIRFSVVKIQK